MMTLVLVVLLRSMMMLVLFLMKVPLLSPILIIWLWPSWPWCWCVGWCWGWFWCWWWCWCCSCWKCHSHPHNLVVTILEWKVDTAQGDLHRQTTYIALFHLFRITFVDICSYFWQAGRSTWTSYFQIIFDQRIQSFDKACFFQTKALQEPFTKHWESWHVQN